MRKYFFSYLFLTIITSLTSSIFGYSYPSLDQAGKIYERLEEILKEKNMYDQESRDTIAYQIVNIYKQSEGSKKELVNNLLIIMINDDFWYNQIEIITKRFTATLTPFEKIKTNKEIKICSFRIAGSGSGKYYVYQDTGVSMNFPTRESQGKVYIAKDLSERFEEEKRYDLSNITKESKILACHFVPEEENLDTPGKETKKTDLLVSPNHIPADIIETYMHALKDQDREVVADIISYADTFNITLYPYKEGKPSLYKAIPDDNGVILMFGLPEEFSHYHIVSYLTVHKGVLYEIYANLPMMREYYKDGEGVFTRKIREIEREPMVFPESTENDQK